MAAYRLVLAGSLLVLVGCGTQRTIHITSEPSGALVHLNDEEVGRTPVAVPFTFYGTYDVRLEAEGYDPLWTKRETVAPLWEYPGPDLLGELVGAEVRKDWHFTMEPAVPAEEYDAARLLDHARQMRARVQAEE